jgi:hypothetical protein
MNADAVELSLLMLACFLAARAIATHDPLAGPRPEARLACAYVAVVLSGIYLGLALSTRSLGSGGS